MGCFCLSRDYLTGRDILHLFCLEKQGLAMRLDKKCGAAASFEKSSHILVEPPVKKAFLSTSQPDLSCTPQISFAEKATSFISA
jgi:hypothetical protein